MSLADQKVALPALAPDRERLLEYDLMRAIARVAKTDKPIVGVMTPLPIFGGMNPMLGMGGAAEPQVFVSELERDYTLKRIGLDATKIDEEIKTLLVIHPRGIGAEAQFALDQFVLRGGKLVVFLDPYAYFDQLPGPMAGQGGTSSNLDKLLPAWGYDSIPGS